MTHAIVGLVVIAAFVAVASATLFATPEDRPHPEGICFIQVPASNDFQPNSVAASKWFAIAYNNADNKTEQEQELFSALGLVDEDAEEFEHKNKTTGLCMVFNVKVEKNTLFLTATFTRNGKSFNKTVELKQSGNNNAVYQLNKRTKQGNVRTQLTIHDTDNKSYLIWNLCTKFTKKGDRQPKQFQGITILAKTPTLAQPKLQQLEKKIDSLGFNPKNFKLVDNKSCKKE